jgi:glutathione S-transferase
MITLHHLEHSRSQRVLWLLEELGVDYEIRHYRRDPKTRLAPTELEKVHPLGKSPVITDGERTVAESAVIIEYLARSYGNATWAPAPGDTHYWDFSYWMHYAEGSLMPPLLLRLVFTRVREDSPLLVRPIAAAIADKVDSAFIRAQIRTHFDHVDAHLAGHEWFVGDQISAADIQMSFPLEAAVARGTVGDRHRHVVDYVQRIQARPAYQRALAAGGDYEFGPAATA